MNTPISGSPDLRSRETQLWIGMVEVQPDKSSCFLGNSRGAFVNIVTWASSTDEFRRKAELVLGKLGLLVIEVEGAEPVSTRREKAELSEELEEIIERAGANPRAIIHGTFHTWRRDDA